MGFVLFELRWNRFHRPDEVTLHWPTHGEFDLIEWAHHLTQSAEGHPVEIRPAEKTVPLPVPPDEYYRDPWKHLRGMYERFGTIA